MRNVAAYLSNPRLLTAFMVAALLLSSAPVVLAQADHELLRMNREVDRLVAKGWLDDALRLAEQALEFGESNLDETHPEFIEALTNLGDVCQARGDNARAHDAYERVLKIQEGALGPDHPDLAKAVEDLATIHRTERSFEEAEQLYRRALDLREKSLTPEDPQFIETLASLAGLLQMRGEYAEASALLQRTIAIQERDLGPDHPDLVEPLRFMSTIHLAQQDKLKAREFSDRAREIETANSLRTAPADAERGAIGITLWINPTTGGAVGTGKGRMYAAKVFFVRTDDLVESYLVDGKVWSNYSWREQRALTCRTTEFIESSYDQKADVYLLNAEPGRYVAVGALVIHAETGRTIAYPGVFSTEISARTEVTVAAGEMVHMGEFHTTIHGAPDSTQRFLFDYFAPAPTPVVEVPGFGSVHYKREAKWIKFDTFDRGGKTESAFWARTRKSFKKDTTWLDRVPDKDHVTESGPAEETSFAKASQRALNGVTSGDFVEAEEFAEQALEICEAMPAAQRRCLAPALGNFAEVLTLKKNRGGAEPLYSRALKLREEQLGSQHPAVAFSLRALARWNVAGGNYEAAETLENRALAIFKQSSGGDTLAVPDSLHSLAQFRERSSDHAQAETLMQQALRIREDSLGWTHPTVAPLLDCLARQSFSQLDHDDAAKFSERAMVVRERFVGSMHPDVAGSVYNLGRAHHELGDYQEAVKQFERAIEIQSAVFGSWSQQAIDSTFALASSYEKLGKPAEADLLRDRANLLCQQKAMDDIQQIADAFVRCADDTHIYPTASDIESLSDQLHPLYIRNMPILDGWGNPYVVDSNKLTFTLKSLGQDGVANPHSGGQTSGFRADIVYFDGSFTQWPESL